MVIDASVSFTKGCYTGQELVARIDSRGGNVPRPLRGLLVEGEPAAVGAEVQAEGSTVGRVTSSATVVRARARSPSAPIARAIELGTTVEVRSGDRRATATVADLPLR